MVARYLFAMVTRQQAQPAPIRSITLKPVTAKPKHTPTPATDRRLNHRLLASIANAGDNIDFGRWLKQESQIPAWQVALTIFLILAASIVVPTMSRHRAATTTLTSASAGVVTDSLPVEIPVPVPTSVAQIQTQSQPTIDTGPSQQVIGLQDSTQVLLKQIQQAQQTNAALRAQIQAQTQTLGATQSEVSAASAEQSTQQQMLQGQMAATVKSASDQLTQLNKSVTALDSQASQLRQTLNMSAPNYPTVTIPDLATSPDPAGAFSAALTSLQAHITAVSSDLQTVKSTAQQQIAFAQSVGSVSPVTTTSQAAIHGNGTFIWPTTGTITQPFGPTSLTLEPAYDGYAHFHLGIDIANAQGTPIAAAAAGTVIFAGWSDVGYGNMVEIDHGNGLVTLYGHMMTTPSVTVGQKVFQGQLIGYMGTTGNSTGPHTHFAVQLNGSWVDPAIYLP